MSNLVAQVNKVIPFLAALVAPAVPLVFAAASIKFFGQVNDLPQYYAAAQMLLSGSGDQVYVLQQLFQVERSIFPALQDRGIALFLPPFALPLLIPVVLMNPASAPIVWPIFLTLATLFSCVIMKQWLRLSWSATCWLWSAICLSGPFYESIRIGQPAPIMLLALCAALLFYERTRSMLAGVSLSILLLKPQQLFPVLIYSLGARRYKTLFAFVIAGAILTAISFGLIGLDGFNNYLALIRDPGSLHHMQPELNPTVRGQLLRLFGSQPWVNGVAVGALLATTGFVFFLGKRLPPERFFMGMAAALPLGLATSLHCHEYDLLLLAPALLIIVVQLQSKFSIAERVACFIGCLPLILPIYAPLHYDYLLQGGQFNPTLLGLLLLSFVAARRCLLRTE